jgi:hypothetical protein
LKIPNIQPKGRKHQYPMLIYTWVLDFLAWYNHFNKTWWSSTSIMESNKLRFAFTSKWLLLRLWYLQTFLIIKIISMFFIFLTIANQQCRVNSCNLLTLCIYMNIIWP